MDEHETVMALHPAPAEWKPQGSRTWRLDLVRHRSPVRLSHARPDAFEPVDLPLRGWRGERPRIYRNADGLWSPHMRWLKEDSYERIPARQVAEYLAAKASHEIVCAFMETPANARMKTWDSSRWCSVQEGDKYPMRISTHPEFRGIEADLDAARGIRWDGRARAAEALQAHLDRSVRIVGGEAYFRRDDMLTATWLKLDTRAGYRLEPDVDPMTIKTDTLLATAENHDALMAYIAEGGDAGFPCQGFDVEAWRRAVPAGLSRGEDAIRVANGACMLLRRCLDRCVAAARAQGEGGSRAAEGLAALRTEALRAEAWAWTGTFGRDDPQAAVEWLLRAMDAVDEVRVPLAIKEGEAMALMERRRSLRDLYLPLLRPEVAAEDVESLTAAAVR